MCLTKYQFYECIGKSSCKGGVDSPSANSSNSQCFTGYEGPMCRVCSQNYTANADFGCDACAGNDPSSSVGNWIFFVPPIIIILLITFVLVVYLDEAVALWLNTQIFKLTAYAAAKKLNAVKKSDLLVEVNGKKQDAFLMDTFPTAYAQWQYVIGTLKTKSIESRVDRLSNIEGDDLQNQSYLYDQDAELMTLPTAVYVYKYREFRRHNPDDTMKSAKRIARRIARKFVNACDIQSDSVVDALFPFLNSGASTLNLGEAIDRAQKRDICGPNFQFNTHKVGFENMVITVAPIANPKGNFWFRPDKAKILISFAQIFNNMQKNFENLQWPEPVQKTMSTFSGFNLDLMRIASVDCVADTSFFTSFTFMLIGNVIVILVLKFTYSVGWKKYSKMLRNEPPTCDICGDKVNDMHHTEQRGASKKSAISKLCGKKPSGPNARIEDADTKNQVEIEMGGVQVSTTSPSKKRRNSFTTKAEKRGIIRDLTIQMKAIMHVREQQLDSFHRRHQKCMGADVNAQSASQTDPEFNEKSLAGWKNRIKIRLNYVIYKTKLWKLLYLFIFIAYVPTSTIILKCLYCREVGDHRYLDADMSIECAGSPYTGYAAIAILMIIFYVVGIPLFLTWTLYQTRIRGVEARWKFLKSEQFELLRDRMLKEAEKRAEHLGLPWKEPRSLEQEGVVLKQHMMDQNLLSYRSVSRVGFLYKEYSIWWFEILQTVLKLTLNGIIVFIGTGTILQLLFFMFTCFLMLCVILQVRPYKTSSNNNVAAFAQLSFFITTFLGFMIKVKSLCPNFDFDVETFALFVVAANVGVVCLCFLSIFWDKVQDDLNTNTDDFEQGTSKHLYASDAALKRAGKDQPPIVKSGAETKQYSRVLSISEDDDD